MKAQIRRLTMEDSTRIVAIINSAATKYENEIPDDLYSEPYMPLDELEDEMEKMDFFGYVTETLLGVIGLQNLDDVSLIRHLYVIPEQQRHGIGTELLDHSIDRAGSDEILVGTWEAATWAIRFYEKNGFDLVDDAESLLQQHWEVPPRQMDESLVLRYRR